MAVICVSNIDRRSTEGNVRSVFEVYGPVSKIELHSNLAFVEMPDEANAQKAIADLAARGSWVVRKPPATA